MSFLKNAIELVLVVIIALFTFTVMLYLSYKAVCNGVEYLIPWLGEPLAFFSLLVVFIVTCVLVVVFVVRVADGEFNRRDRNTIDN